MTEKVAAIDAALKEKKLEYVIGVYSDVGGHAVLPHAIEYPDENTAKIHVYDSNWPGKDRFITVDMKEDSWSFSFAGTNPDADPKIWSGGKGDFDLTSMTARSDGRCPFCGEDGRVKSSLFVIRASTLDWSIGTSTGTVSPAIREAGEARLNPLKAAAENVRDFMFVNPPAADDGSVSVSIPKGTAIQASGLTGGASVEFSTQGEAAGQVEITESSVTSNDAGTIVTLAQGNLVATANGAQATIEVKGETLAVAVTTTSGQPVSVVVDSSAPAVEVRTAGNPELGTSGGYQILQQTAANEVTVKTVTESGIVTETKTEGVLAAATPQVRIAAALEGPAENPLLPNAVVRDVIVESTTTATTSTSTSTSSTTLAPTTTTRPRPTTTTTTVAPTTTATTTTTTIAPTTTTLPPIAPWVRQTSALSNEQYQTVVTDRNGNIYATGYFCAATITIGATTLTNRGAANSSCDGFVEKVNANGDVQWVTQLGAAGQDFPWAVAVDSSGGVYFGMQFSTTHTFGNSTVTFASGGGQMFGKLSSNGTPVWGVGVTSDGSLGNLDISADANVFVSFDLVGTSKTANIGSTTVTSTSARDVVVARVNPATGVVTWVTTITGSGGTQVHLDTVADSGGNGYVLAQFDSATAIIGSTTLTNAGSGSGSWDAVVVKYSSSGSVSYAKRFGSSLVDNPRYLDIDATDVLHIAFSSLAGAIDWDGQQLINTIGAGQKTLGVLRVNTTGVLLGEKLFAVPSGASVGGLAVDGSGNVYVAGTYSNSTFQVGSTTLANPGSNTDLFVFKFSSAGAVEWAKSFGGSGNEYMQGGDGGAIDSRGYPVLVFDSWSPTITIGSQTYTNNGIDMFMIHSNSTGDV